MPSQRKREVKGGPTCAKRGRAKLKGEGRKKNTLLYFGIRGELGSRHLRHEKKKRGGFRISGDLEANERKKGREKREEFDDEDRHSKGRVA